MSIEQATKKPRRATVPKAPRAHSAADLARDIFDQTSKDFDFGVDGVQIAASGAIFITGWVDDRSSRLQQIRIRGEAWSQIVEGRYVGRHRRPNATVPPGAGRLFGFWALTTHDRSLILGKSCAIELALTNGTSKTCSVAINYVDNEKFRARFANFWAESNEADRAPPTELTYVEMALKRPVAGVAATMPKHNVENVTVCDEGGVFINGWIDDTNDRVEGIDVLGSLGRVTLDGVALARTFRDDVQTALGLARKHQFGFWGLAADGLVQQAGANVSVELRMASGARQRHDIEARGVDRVELRNIALCYLAAAKYLGNPMLAGVASLEHAIGDQIIKLSRAIAGTIASDYYIESFGEKNRPLKGSIVVCLYGKPEYLFLQNALCSGRPGIEDYEFIYVCNSPELAEPLFREARTAAFAYDVTQTLIILPGNAGFGAANNLAARAARSGRLLFMNPDVFPRDLDWAAKHTQIVEQLSKEQTTLFGAPLYYDDGSLMHGGMYFELDRGLSATRASFKSMNFLRVEHYGKGAPPQTKKFIQPRAVAAVTGAFVSVDRNWFEHVGGFSEDYVFGHYEDADLCLKSIDKGIIPWIHDIRLWHLEGKGSHRLPAHEGASIVNRWLFNKTWGERLVPDMLGPSPRLVLAPLSEKTNAPVDVQDRLIGFCKDGNVDLQPSQEEIFVRGVQSRSRRKSADIEINFGGA